MKKSFYFQLALDSLRKNKRLYVPYLITCIGAVMMHYIISYLAVLPNVVPMKGGATMATVMILGKAVIGFFSVIFLFYSYSFLIRRRNREFGLYNILGMDKRHIGKILFWETLIVLTLSLVLGIGFGVLFSKLAELAMVRLLSGEISYNIRVSNSSLLQTIVLFTGIFAVLMLFSLGKIHFTNPLALFRSENYGEKPPKANWILAILGVILLGAAYFMAISIEQPITALMMFFVAVLMVIVATYLLFIAGSVTLCRFLQKRKHYYYKANHFISVSSMSYRMKRNGAGLASICILMTMVLVMLSSTGSLMIGGMNSLRTAYPFDLEVTYHLADTKIPDEERAQELYDMVLSQAKDRAVDPVGYWVGSTAGILEENHNLMLDASALNGFDSSTYDTVRMVYLFSLADYNRIAGENVTLEPDSLLVYGSIDAYPYDSVSFHGGKSYRIQQSLNKFPSTMSSAEPVSTFFFVAENPGEILAPLEGMVNSFQVSLTNSEYIVGFNMASGQDSDAVEVVSDLYPIQDSAGDDYFGFSVSCFSDIREDFFSFYGSLFFLGVILSVVFLSATVLIIYYKQISEGFEDQQRFGIMQRVGLTRKEIRQSINSQVLTVFFLPLLMAGLHTACAFPMIWRMLQFLGVINLKLMIVVNLGCFLIFGAFYALVYRITSNTYFRIVSSAKA